MLILVAPAGASQDLPRPIRGSRVTSKFLGIGTHLSKVARGTWSEDSMIIAGCLLKSVTPRVCAPDRETPLSMSTEERWTTFPEFTMGRRRCRPFEKKRQPIAIGVFIHSTFATAVCRA